MWNLTSLENCGVIVVTFKSMNQSLRKVLEESFTVLVSNPQELGCFPLNLSLFIRNCIFLTWNLYKTENWKISFDANFSFPFLLDDPEPPGFSECPSNVVVSAPFGAASAVVTWTEPTANASVEQPTVTSTNNPGGRFTIGVTAITYTAIDMSGLQAFCTFNVIVRAGVGMFIVLSSTDL